MPFFFFFLDRVVIFVYFLLSVVKSSADLLSKKTKDDFVSPIRHPDLGPFSTNAIVRKNLLQALMLSQSAPLAKEAKTEMVTKRMRGRKGITEEDKVYPTA